MVTKSSPQYISEDEIQFYNTLNECDRRRYAAIRANGLGYNGVCKVTKIFGIDKNTVYRGKRELANGFCPGGGRIRQRGGGRKPLIPAHPEWVDALKTVIEPFSAGLPQDDAVIWVSLTVSQIKEKLKETGFNVSDYIVKKILSLLGYKKRSFIKNLVMRDVEQRDAQFVMIKEIKGQCGSIGVPVIIIDTKKKEMIGNFKRDGQAYSKGQPQSADHDFSTFSEGLIVPHGIYDVADNKGYMTIGTSHDTSQFVCDNIERVWNEHLMNMYPGASTIAILCDGGGSNSSSHKIVKQDFMDLADRMGMNLLIMHYPPYCSKFNPIEHRLFSQITRSWAGAPLLSVDEAAQRAANTTTKNGLRVNVDIVHKKYDIKRTVLDSYEKRLEQQVVFHKDLPKWNYFIKPREFY